MFHSFVINKEGERIHSFIQQIFIECLPFARRCLSDRTVEVDKPGKTDSKQTTDEIYVLLDNVSTMEKNKEEREVRRGRRGDGGGGVSNRILREDFEGKATFKRSSK